MLRSLLLTTVLFNLFAPILNAQITLFATRELGLSPLLLGLAMVVAGACGVLASTVTSAISAQLGTGRTMMIAAGLICGGWLLVPFVPGMGQVAFALLALGSSVGTMGDVLFNINSVTLRQALVPDRLRGRVNASYRVVILGVQPLGALVGGGLGFGVGFLSMCFLPLRRVRQPEITSD